MSKLESSPFPVLHSLVWVLMSHEGLVVEWPLSGSAEFKLWAWQRWWFDVFFDRVIKGVLWPLGLACNQGDASTLPPPHPLAGNQGDASGPSSPHPQFQSHPSLLPFLLWEIMKLKFGTQFSLPPTLTVSHTHRARAVLASTESYNVLVVACTLAVT